MREHHPHHRGHGAGHEGSEKRFGREHTPGQDGFEKRTGRERGGRGPRVFAPGDLKLLLLALIAEQPCHGYDLIRQIEGLFDGAYSPSPGVIYPTLTFLEESELDIEAVALARRAAEGGIEADNRNANELLGLQTKATVGADSQGNGGVSMATSYSQLVSKVGG